MREIPVLFENDFCLVLNKPSGLPVQGGKGIKHSLDTLLSEKMSPKPLLVHRIDRDTSGLILVAKTREAAAGFSALFAINSRQNDHQKGKNGASLVKRYLGVCSGVFREKQGKISSKLEVRGKEKECETFYRPLSTGDAGSCPCSLLELDLGSGRMHQIRRHLALSGHPILGDDKYGDFRLNKDLRKALGLKHLLLHASRLIIPGSTFLPGGLDIEAPPPEYFLRFLELLQSC